MILILRLQSIEVVSPVFSVDETFLRLPLPSVSQSLARPFIVSIAGVVANETIIAAVAVGLLFLFVLLCFQMTIAVVNIIGSEEAPRVARIPFLFFIRR
jgi:hypothetical protein